MCIEQALIFPGCYHFSTQRLQRCYPRGRATACQGKTIVSQIWAHQSLCSSCRVSGRPSGGVTANPTAWGPLGGYWARAEHQGRYPWAVYGMYPQYPVSPPDLSTTAGDSPPPYTPPASSTAVPPTPANNRPWEQFIDRAPMRLPPQSRECLWEQLMDSTLAPQPQLPLLPAGTVGPSPWGEFMDRARGTTTLPPPREGNSPWSQFQTRPSNLDQGISPAPPSTSLPKTDGQGSLLQANNSVENPMSTGSGWGGFHVNDPTCLQTSSSCRTATEAAANQSTSAAWTEFMGSR